MDTDNKYTQMQLNHYNSEASKWSETNPDPVVGSFNQHNNWADYEILFQGIENLGDKVMLDFACGPCRNIVKYNGRFKRVDGIDLSPINISNGELYLKNNNVEVAKLYVSNGIDLQPIQDKTYDIVMSVIALQHICVHEIRYSIFKDIFRVLKSGGVFTAQMGFGTHSPYTVGYYENFYEATGTNRACDTRVESPDYLKKDLEEIGFTDFTFEIRPVGPGDCHPNWIFFKAFKK